MQIEKAIQLLVDEAVKYHTVNDKGEFDLKSFLGNLQKKYDTTLNKEGLLTHEGHTTDQQIITHLGRLGRYAHVYLKNALEKTMFTTDMDFAFTAILHQYGPLGKTDLIKMMVYEKSSGMEIIKRLIKNGIFEQTANPKDKRSKLVNVTEKGAREVVAAYQVADIAPKVVSLPLSDTEKDTLLQLLLKMDDFHNAHFLKGEDDPYKILASTE